MLYPGIVQNGGSGFLMLKKELQQHSSLTGIVIVLAFLHPRKTLSPKQTRTDGHLRNYKSLGETSKNCVAPD